MFLAISQTSKITVRIQKRKDKQTSQLTNILFHQILTYNTPLFTQQQANFILKICQFTNNQAFSSTTSSFLPQLRPYFVPRFHHIPKIGVVLVLIGEGRTCEVGTLHARPS